ncbi:glycosyltransferase [Oceanobacillus sp. 143]|nr:glycosyltransferase [Oceanobacillus sp. 143]
MKPDISIIVPIYNVEKYLEACLNSILAQSYFDFELILVNDGSLDRSGEICDLYAEKDNRIRVIHKMNGGVSSARNKGINTANGKYIGFVDPDDTILPTMFELLIKSALEHNADIVVSPFTTINLIENKVSRSAVWEEIHCVIDKKNIEKQLVPKLLNDNYYGYSIIPCWNKLYKKVIFLTIISNLMKI